MGLVRLYLSETLHKRVKTCAAHNDKKIPDYIIGLLEDVLPREIKFDDDATTKKQPRPVS